MKRIINYDLLRWKISKPRKPLLLRGARQVGKTHAVRELGKKFTHFIEINFEKNPEFIEVFEKNLDPKRIVSTLVVMTNQTIIPEKTLLFFDEIQSCPNAITSLRYFYEEMPELHVIAAGSLLDFAIEKNWCTCGSYSILLCLSSVFYGVSCGTKKQIIIGNDTFPSNRATNG